MTSAWIFPAAVGSVWLLGFPIIRELNRRQVLDRPNERSSHAVSTPRGGGIAVVAVLLAGFAMIGLLQGRHLPFLLCGATFALASISFLDDLKSMPARVRFAVQTMVAAGFLFGLQWKSPPISTFPIPGVFLFAFLIVILVGYTNAFNFMDGINGIAGGQAFITGFGTAMIALRLNPSAETMTIALCALLVSGAALGFLPHNFPRASVFMGDVGSVPLGFLLAALAITTAAARGWWLLVPFALLHANFLLDTSITLARRALRGEKIYTPHKEHFYQRFVRAGQSHTWVTTAEMLLQLFSVILLYYYLRADLSTRILIAASIILYWLLFFAWAETLFRRSNRVPLLNPSNQRAG
jgi:UDP-N-acetylmuramyl pentapeptide phosphotransferase/UDP-N-acetylglucosamine-1-phosphate transferase